MIRILFALVLGALLTAAAPQGSDYRAVTGTASAGGFTTGNPAAKIALVEYLSFTCPHCAHFAAESKAGLHDGWVRSGAVKVEVRSAVRDPFDMAAWTLARCGGPGRFAALSTAIFGSQETWINRGNTWIQANMASVKALPPPQQIRTVATNSGLDDIGLRAGLTKARLDQCYADPAITKALLAMTDAAFAKIKGTPAFEINGTLADGVNTWAGLEPALRAAGAK